MLSLPINRLRTRRLMAGMAIRMAVAVTILTLIPIQVCWDLLLVPVLLPIYLAIMCHRLMRLTGPLHLGLVATSTMSTARNTNTSSTVYRRPARVARVISPSRRHPLRSRSTVKADSPFNPLNPLKIKTKKETKHFYFQPIHFLLLLFYYNNKFNHTNQQNQGIQAWLIVSNVT
jgi:hypothetical protein